MKRSKTDLGKAPPPGTGRSYPEMGRALSSDSA